MNKIPKGGWIFLSSVISVLILLCCFGIYIDSIEENRECHKNGTCKNTYGLVIRRYGSKYPYKRSFTFLYYIGNEARCSTIQKTLDEIRKYNIKLGKFYEIEYDSLVPSVLKIRYDRPPYNKDSAIAFYKKQGIDFNINDYNDAKYSNYASTVWSDYMHYLSSTEDE